MKQKHFGICVNKKLTLAVLVSNKGEVIRVQFVTGLPVVKKIQNVLFVPDHDLYKQEDNYKIFSMESFGFADKGMSRTPFWTGHSVLLHKDAVEPAMLQKVFDWLANQTEICLFVDYKNYITHTTKICEYLQGLFDVDPEFGDMYIPAQNRPIGLKLDCYHSDGQIPLEPVMYFEYTDIVQVSDIQGYTENIPIYHAIDKKNVPILKITSKRPDTES